MKTMTERMENCIAKSGMTKAEVMRLSGINKSTFYYLFSEKINLERVQLETLRPIAKVLGVSLDYLITGKEPEKSTTKPQEAPKTQVQELYDSLSVASQKYVISIMEALVDVQKNLSMDKLRELVDRY